MLGKGEPDPVEKLLAVVSQEVKKLSQQIDNNRKRVEVLNQRQNTLSKSIESLHKEYEELLQKQKVLESTLSNLLKRVQEIEKRLSAIENNPPQVTRENKIIVLPPKEAKRLVDEILGYTE